MKFKEYLAETDFIVSVRPKWTPPKDTFSLDTPITKTAKIVADASKDYKQAVDRVEFYFNRAGKNIPNGKERAKKIIDELKKIFKK